jgi:hypothetical protein
MRGNAISGACNKIGIRKFINPPIAIGLMVRPMWLPWIYTYSYPFPSPVPILVLTLSLYYPTLIGGLILGLVLASSRLGPYAAVTRDAAAAGYRGLGVWGLSRELSPPPDEPAREVTAAAAYGPPTPRARDKKIPAARPCRLPHSWVLPPGWGAHSLGRARGQAAPYLAAAQFSGFWPPARETQPPIAAGTMGPQL